jgi:hypothetical protein
MVVAVIALIVACSGSAVAASLITGKQIAKNTVTGKNLKNGSVTLSDISKKTQAALKGNGGAAGANGNDGAPGGDVAITGPSSIFEEKRGAKITPDGAALGPFVDNSQLGDAVIFHGFDGKKLADLAQVAYTASYHHDPGPANVNGPDNGDAPYMLITLNGFDHDIAFSPSTQPGACYSGAPTPSQCQSSDQMIHYEVSKGTVRYDDDPGSGVDSKWQTIVSQHPDDVISGIRVQAGNSLSGTQSAIVNSLTVEAKGAPPTTYFFGH